MWLLVVEGEARILISQVAARMVADLVIVGNAFRPGTTPQTTTTVVRHAPCSVLVIDSGTARATAQASLQVG
jgi:nucleotide-binding universal stress UspA family protein